MDCVFLGEQDKNKIFSFTGATSSLQILSCACEAHGRARLTAPIRTALKTHVIGGEGTKKKPQLGRSGELNSMKVFDVFRKGILTLLRLHGTISR